MEETCDIKELSIVREYFSHNIRTSTAMVVATVMVCKCGLGDDMESMSDVISESAYFLDVYDKGMEILFDFVLGNQVSNDMEEIQPSRIINHFKSKLPLTIVEQGINLSVETDDFTTHANSHIVKNVMEIILCEEVRKNKSTIVIKGINGQYSITKSSPSEPPRIYYIFTKLLMKLGITFIFGRDKLELRFK